MPAITITTTEPKQVIDITETVAGELKNSTGLCHVNAQHTTVGLTTADLDPGTDQDLLDAFTAMVPKLQYRHPHDPSHVPDHILSALIGTDVTLPVSNGQLVLGQWQRLVLIEFNGPQERQLTVIQTTAT